MPDRRPTPTESLRKTVARVRARGPAEIAALVVGRIREAIASSDELVVLVRAAEPDADEESQLRPSGAELRRATDNDAVAYARDIGTDAASTFRGRLSPDTRCYVVVLDGRLVHATWCTTTAAWARELGAYLRPPPGDAYVYESFTSPAVRGRGIYPFALRGIASLLASEGIRRVWVAAETGNHASLRAIDKAGFRPSFRIAFKRRWGRLSVGTFDAPKEGLRLEKRAT